MAFLIIKAGRDRLAVKDGVERFNGPACHLEFQFSVILQREADFVNCLGSRDNAQSLVTLRLQCGAKQANSWIV